MIKYAQVIDKKTKTCAVGVGTDIETYQKMGMKEMDVEQAYNGSWYLAGYAPKKPEPTKEEKIAGLKQELNEVDEKSTRSIRAVLAGTATDEDKEFLASLEEQAEDLRQQIKDLQGE